MRKIFWAIALAMLTNIALTGQGTLSFIHSTVGNTPDTLRLVVDPNPPLPLITTTPTVLALGPPAWAVFIAFGDGHFVRDTLNDLVVGSGTETFDYTHYYASNDPVSPVALMTAVYSRDRNLKISTGGTGPVTPTAAPSKATPVTPFNLPEAPEGGNIWVFPSWTTARPKPDPHPSDEIYVGIAYKQPEEGGYLEGIISFSYMDDHFSFVEGPVAGSATPVLLSTTTTGGIVTREWKVSVSSNRQDIFFVGLKAKNTVTIRDTFTPVTSPLWLGVEWIAPPEIITEDIQRLEIEKGETQTSTPSKKGLLDVMGARQLVVVSPSDTREDRSPILVEDYARGEFSFNESDTAYVDLRLVNDPNNISIVPMCFLANQEQEQKAHVMVKFFNNGSAGVSKLEVITEYDPDQWQPGRTSVEYFPDKTDLDFLVITEELSLGSYVDSFYSDPEGRIILLSIPDIQDALAAVRREEGRASSSSSIEKELTRWAGGTINFDVNTQPNLRVRDSIGMTARIIMDNVELKRVQNYPICRYCGPKLRWQYGIRYMVFLPGNELLTNGHGLRLTLSKPIGRLRAAPPSTQSFINIRELPAWWLQWEAGISGLSLSGANGDSLRLRYVDVMPLQLRWIPRKGLGNLSASRRIGLSAGYTFSYLYRGTVEGATFTPKSAADRIEHSVGGSIDYGNILRRPGLSFGLGYNFRWTRYNGAVQRYGHPYLYIHYNLPYRLRF